MLIGHDEILAREGECIAVCGRRYGPGTVHVGVFWSSEDQKKIFHFQGADDIKLEDANEITFQNYLFAIIPDFNLDLLPLLAATAKKVADNTINGFEFRREGALYDGGKFEYVNGAWTGKTGPEKFINCGIFVFAFLQSFEKVLIQWDSWPNADTVAKGFLEIWLNQNNIPIPSRFYYYNKTKVVRGKHILVSPLTYTQPSPYQENDPIATQNFG